MRSYPIVSKVIFGFVVLMFIFLVFVILYEKKIDSKARLNSPFVSSKKHMDSVDAKLQIPEYSQITRIENESYTDEVANWLEEINYLPRAKQSYLKQHDQQQLILLADAGDTVAMEALAELYIHDKRSDEAVPYLEEAIVRGSYRAITTMANINMPFIFMDDEYKDPISEVKPKLIESFAYIELLNKFGVGALFAASTIQDAYLDRFMQAYSADDDGFLSESDYIDIDQQASKLLAKYESRRIELGLGEFESSFPPDVRKYIAYRKSL